MIDPLSIQPTSVRRHSPTCREIAVSLALYAHPFSSYCQKALIALYENDTPFEYRKLDEGEHMAQLEALWPIKRFPILTDGATTILEATCIIEYLAVHYPGAVELIPRDPALAVEVRMLDRFFDNYVSTPQQKVVFDALRADDNRDPQGVADARRGLEAAYAWLEERMTGRHWAVGDRFSMADCAAAPFLFYAHWTQPISAAFVNVHAYRERLLARPSFARAVEEARPYRRFFPLEVPETELLR
jgi:glutathione S-transferase